MGEKDEKIYIGDPPICPYCGGNHIEVINEYETEGVDICSSTCGYACLGPLGLLCGMLDMGTTKNNIVRVCKSCGKKFK